MIELDVAEIFHLKWTFRSVDLHQLNKKLHR